jgi:hypothetical protein
LIDLVFWLPVTHNSYPYLVWILPFPAIRLVKPLKI